MQIKTNKDKSFKFLDLFAGAGGLCEGFIQKGFNPISHVEMDTAACYTLKTRMAYYYCKRNNKLDLYYSYLQGEISREAFYSHIPLNILDSVINKTISDNSFEDICTIIDKQLDGDSLDLIIGGPPCQAYSLMGRARDVNHMLDDDRNYLYTFYARFLEKYQPKYFVFENVLGLFSAKDKNGMSYLKQMRDLFKKNGYTTKFQLLNSHDYGVLQNRKRIILIGKLNDKNFEFPQIKQWKPNAIVNDALLDLNPLQAGTGNIRKASSKKPSKWLKQANICSLEGCPITYHIARFHNDRDLKIYKKAITLWNHENQRLSYANLPSDLQTHKNTTTFIDRYKVVEGNQEASHTVVAHIAKDGHYYIHPDEKQNRSLTPREAARLQSFPDDYYFEGVKDIPCRTDAFKQIGNAVPVLMAKAIAETMKQLLIDKT